MIRNYKGKLVRDTRKWYSFVVPDGRKAETLAHSLEEAKERIEKTLNVQLKEAV